MLKFATPAFGKEEREKYANKHGIRFASAGIPISTPAPKSTIEGIVQCNKLGLRAMELEFVQGVKMKNEMAQKVADAARENEISLSIHAPYFINLCSDDKAKLANSRRHIIESARIGAVCNASPIVFHPGFYQKKDAKECEKRIIEQMKIIFGAMEDEKIKNIKLGPELTGKASAFGNLDEIAGLSREFGVAKCIPVIDFAHFHAREGEGRIKGKEEYEKMLDFCEDELGAAFKSDFHAHFSGIEFTAKGERRHIPVKENSPPYRPLLQILKERKYCGTIVCESPLIEKDALFLQKEYEKI